MSETDDGAGEGASQDPACSASVTAVPAGRPSHSTSAAPVNPASAHPGAQSSTQPVKAIVAFNRRELDVILRLYGRMVAEGEWRDYAIDLLKDRAVFSVFRRTSEMPLYRIEKDPKLARKQGAYSVVAAGGMILKRGQDLAQVLKVLDKKKHLRLVDA
ncbi:DUF2794 domain-containing protein [Roseibium suaedae]|uniref:DUF2794 domain-containing protein n=1 Tax=Roseibium suaedae TaxID=735517 RepID=A0A1M7N0L3_9HYPH|nr:DUF2794 domain-containing protein [Roseibium suaedae]SHM96900.1 Protein of unknown function [Roseibium suaedae]